MSQVSIIMYLFWGGGGYRSEFSRKVEKECELD